MKRTHDGFTLLEMLVALSIAALLVSLVYGAVRVGQRSASALGVHTSQAEVMRIGWQFLHDAIVRAQSVPDPLDPENRAGFSGRPDAIEFFADMPAHVGLGGLMRIHLDVREETGRARLLLTRTRPQQQLPAAAGSESGEQAVLVEDLESLRIEYFGPLGDGSDPAWYTSWDAPRTLPNLIRVSVQPVDTRAWPVLVAGPLLGTAPLSMEMPEDDAPIDEAVEGEIQ